MGAEGSSLAESLSAVAELNSSSLLNYCTVGTIIIDTIGRRFSVSMPLLCIVLYFNQCTFSELMLHLCAFRRDDNYSTDWGIGHQSFSQESIVQ